MGFSVIERCEDPELIKSFIINSEIFEEIAEDGFKPSEYHPDMNNGWFLHKEDKETCGIWMVELRNGISLEVHPMVPKRFRGKIAYKGAKEFFAWVTRNTHYEKVNAEIATCFPNVKMFALQLGFKAEGTIRQSFKKNDKIHDQWILGITRKELKDKYGQPS